MLKVLSNTIEALEQHTANLTISSDQEAKLSKDLAKKEAKQAAKQSKLCSKSERKRLNVKLKKKSRKSDLIIARNSNF